MLNLILRNPKLIFWDFDGVVKESIEVKTSAFVDLFLSFGVNISEKVRRHHEVNGGMSRFEKLPLYLEWAEEPVTRELVEDYCRRFSRKVFQGVIDAPYVPGVEEYLRKNKYQQKFVLVTATPQEEIEKILVALDLQSCFTAVFGSPMSKKEAIYTTLVTRQLPPQCCLMIGDATADHAAAKANHVPFLLRRHATNVQAFAHYNGDSMEDLKDL